MAVEIPKSIKASLYIDGKPAEASFKNINQKTNELRRELNGLTVGTQAWNQKLKELQIHERTLKNIKDEIKGVNGAFAFLKTEAGKLGSLAAGYLGFDMVTDQFRDIIVKNAALSDSLADVRKTTGLTEEGVRRLTTELDKLDTRSSRAELLGLAEVAGKLGVAGERDVLGFVRAADKIKVALGGDLGDAEAAVNVLGKLTELFKLKDAYGLEDAMIRTGSAINDLGASGAASEAYIVEFTKRMGSVAPQANISLQSLLGLAATMDELGQNAEASSTALSMFVVGMGKDVPGFARIAGLSVSEFSNLLKTDGNQALIEVLKNLKSTGQGAAGLAEKMGLIGEDGARATAALGVLSNNLDLLVQKQKLANDSFALGTSLQKEFDVKNSNLAATVAETGKIFDSVASNTVLIDFLKNLVHGFNEFLRGIERNAVVFVTLIKLLLVAAAGWVAYKIAVMSANSAIEVNIARTVLGRTATLAWAAAQALFAGNTTRAAAALRLLNLTASANPFGAIAAAVVALATAIYLFSQTTSEAAKIQEGLNSIEADALKARKSEIITIQALQKVMSSESETRERKLAAVRAMRNLQPDILKGLSDEAALTNKGTEAIAKYVKALEARTLAEAAQNRIRKLQEEKIDLESNTDTTIWQDIKAGAMSMRGSSIDMGVMAVKQSEYITKNIKDKSDAIDREIKAINEKYGAGMVDNLLRTGDVATGGASTGGLTDQKTEDRKAREAENRRKKAEEEARKLADELKKIREEQFVNSLSKDDAEIESARLKYEKLREAAKGNAKALAEIAGLEAAEITAITNKQKEEQLKKDQELLKSKVELEQQIYELGLSEEMREQAELDRKYEALILQADKFGLDSTALFKFWEDEKLRILEESGKKQLEEQDKKNKEDREKELKHITDKAKLGSIMAEAASSVFEIIAGSQAEFANYQKVITGIQIAIDTAAAISAATKTGAYVGLTPIEKAIAIAGNIAVVLASIAKAKQLLTKAPTAKAPQFAEGGFSDSDPEGYVSNATIFRRSSTGRPFMAGESGREWIAPNWMLKQPAYANIIGMLEGARQDKRSFISTTTSPETPGGNGGYDFARLESMIISFIETQSKVNERPVNFNYRLFQQKEADNVRLMDKVNA